MNCTLRVISGLVLGGWMSVSVGLLGITGLAFFERPDPVRSYDAVYEGDGPAPTFYLLPDCGLSVSWVDYRPKTPAWLHLLDRDAPGYDDGLGPEGNWELAPGVTFARVKEPAPPGGGGANWHVVMERRGIDPIGDPFIAFVKETYRIALPWLVGVTLLWIGGPFLVPSFRRRAAALLPVAFRPNKRGFEVRPLRGPRSTS